MPSPLRSSNRKKHALSDSHKFEEFGSSDVISKKLKREDGSEKWTEKQSKFCGGVEQDTGPVHRKRKTMDSRIYTSSFKLPLKNEKAPGCSGVSTSSGSQFLRRPTDKVYDGGTRSHDLNKSLQNRLKPNILKRYCPELPPKSPIKEKESSRGVKRLEWKLEKRMKKLVRKQQKEIDEFHRIWDEHKVQLLEQHRQRTSPVSPRHNNNPDKLNEHKRLDDELKFFLEEHKNKREISLKDLKTRHFAKKTKEIEKKARWLEEMRSSPQVEPSCTMPSDETDPDYLIEPPTISPSPNHEPSSANLLAFVRRSTDDCAQLSNKYRSVISSENSITAELSSSEGLLPSGPASTVEEVIESVGIELVASQRGSGNDSDINIIAKLPPDEEQLPDESLPCVEKVIKAAGNELRNALHGSEDCIISMLPSSEEQLPDVPPSNVEVIKSACNDLVGGLLGSGNVSQISFVTNSPSSDVQLPLGGLPSAEEEMTSAGNKLHERSQSPIRAQMEYTEAPAQTDDGQLPTEVGESNRTVHEATLTNLSEQLQQPPSADIPGDINMPTSASTPPPCGDNHVLMLVIPEHQPLQPSAETPVGSNQPTLSSPSPGSDHELMILTNPSEDQQLSPSVKIPVDMNQATSASTSVVEQLPCSQELLVSINREAPQPSQFPQFPADTNPLHPIPTSVVEPAPRREINIVTLNAEARTQYENSQPPTNQSMLCVRDVSRRINQPDPHIAFNYNHEVIEGTPVLPNQLNFQTHSGITPSISSFVGDLRSHPMLQGTRQVAPQITAQRLSSNPLCNEYQRLCRESESMVKSHENMKLQLKYDCEKELAEIRKKYDLKLQDAEAAFSAKKKELDINSTKVWMHGLYAQSFQDMSEYKSTIKLPQDASSNPTQQVHRAHSQAQLIFSPSISTSLDSVLSASNGQNRPQLNIAITPPRLNIQNNAIQVTSSPFQNFRPIPPFSATTSASASPRVPPHHLVYPPTRFSGGPQSAIRSPSLENPSPYRQAVFSYLQNQIGRLPSSLLPSVSASSSNLGLVSQFMAASNGMTQGTMSANNGVSQGTNIRHSGRTPGLICLSDDE